MNLIEDYKITLKELNSLDNTDKELLETIKDYYNENKKLDNARIYMLATILKRELKL